MSKTNTILMVDDDPILVRNLGRLLVKHGFDVITAASPKEALEALEQNHIDLCITDLAMPDKSGLDLLTTIRADDRWSSLPVVVSSGFGQKMFKEVCSFGPVRVFQKPIQIEDLLSTLKDVFD